MSQMSLARTGYKGILTLTLISFLRRFLNTPRAQATSATSRRVAGHFVSAE